MRTLLLNQDASAGPGYDYHGEEYVPAAFKARAVAAPLASVRRALFGPSPDRAMLNYRLRQLLCCIHSCELEEYVYAKDPRVTYWPFDDTILRAAVRGPVVTQTAGDARTLYVLRPIIAVESAGRLKQQWRIEVIDGSSVTVQSYNDTGLFSTVTQGYTLTDSLSSILVLPNSALQYRFQAGVGSAWQVDLLAKPALGLAAVASALSSAMTDPVREALFGPPRSLSEPYRTFQNLWDLHDVTAYRLGAVALALAYRMDEEA